MKYPYTQFTTSMLLVLFASGGLSIASAQSSKNDADKPTVITPPATKDGSNASRAPLPAARPADDVKPPDGEAIDKTTPPNTPATRPETPPGKPQIKIHAGPGTRVTPSRIPVPPPEAAGTADPVLTPTGRPAVAVATSLESAKFAPTIRLTTISTRDPVMADIESRMKASERAMAAANASMAGMSDEGRKQFKAAAEEVKDKARELKRSVQAARKATEQDWDAARTELASDYEAYAAALAKVDAVSAAAIPSR
jgi:hypothetical protein